MDVKFKNFAEEIRRSRGVRNKLILGSKNKQFVLQLRRRAVVQNKFDQSNTKMDQIKDDLLERIESVRSSKYNQIWRNQQQK